MSIGYFIGRGDKTTCGGTVLEGDDTFSLFGLPHAREGDLVSCGKDGKHYQIVGGVTHILSEQRMVAGTLDSFSNCPCRAQLIPSNFEGSYRNDSTTSRAVKAPVQPTSTTSESHSASSRQFSAAPSASNHSSTRLNNFDVQEPGFYIVPKSTTRQQLESNLFTLRDPAVMGKFKLLNPNLGDVKAGSMIVLSDPNNYQCTRQEALLMDMAAKTNRIIETLSAEEADFMMRHRSAIQAFLDLGSKAVGVGASILENNLENVRVTLKELEELHQRSFVRDGHLGSPTFLAERQRLFQKLDLHMTSLTRKSIGFPHHPNLNRALFLSPPSLVHHWTAAGVPGQMPGYATHFDGVAKASKYIKYGGWVGTAIGGGASVLKVQEVCTAGNLEACKRVKFTEAGSFTGGVAGGGALGLALGVKTVGGICLAIGPATAGVGTLLCGVVVVTAGSLLGGAVGSKIGEELGDVVYEMNK